MKMSASVVFSIFLIFVSEVGYSQGYVRFASLISPTVLKQHVSVLASDSLEGRETAEPGMQKAVAYVEKELRSFGLKPAFGNSFRQEVPFVKWSLGSFTISLGEKEYIPGTDFYMLPPGNTNQLFFSSKSFWVCAIDTFSSKIKTPEHATIILLTSHVKNISNDSLNTLINATTKLIGEMKPAAVLVERNFAGEREKRQIRRMENGMLSVVNNQKEAQPPIAYISPSVYHDVRKKGKRHSKTIGPNIHIKENMTIRINGYRTTCYNVAGIIPGVELSDEYVVLTAHLDHLGKRDSLIYYGADDDGSGCAAVLNLAGAFAEAKRQGETLKRSVIFMLFTGEEKGLLGSNFYTENPPVPMEKTIANLNIDMIGRVDTVSRPSNRYVYLIGSDRMSTDLHQISENTNTGCCNINLDYTYNDPSHPMRLYFRSDHYSFVKKGVPAIFYFTGLHDDYHKPTDTVDKIDFEKTADITQLIFSTAWELANRTDRIRVDKP
ncbi:MAG: M28 family peptidase [Bacteroidota bacterium]